MRSKSTPVQNAEMRISSALYAFLTEENQDGKHGGSLLGVHLSLIRLDVGKPGFATIRSGAAPKPPNRLPSSRIPHRVRPGGGQAPLLPTAPPPLTALRVPRSISSDRLKTL